MEKIKKWLKSFLDMFKTKPEEVIEVEEPEEVIEVEEPEEVIEETENLVEMPYPKWHEDRVLVSLDFALSITGRFEGKGYHQLSGNFDGQGVSVGMFQWNFGQGTIQSEIFKPLLNSHGKGFVDAFFPEPVCKPADDPNCIEWVEETMLTRNKRVFKPEWKKAWNNFLRNPKVIQQQKKASMTIAKKAVEILNKYKLYDLKSFCFMIDIVVQNGSLKGIDKPIPDIKEYKKYISEVGGSNADIWSTYQVDDLTMILTQWAGLRALKNRWRKDVLTRKITIAHGRGTVHGIKYSINYKDMKVST